MKLKISEKLKKLIKKIPKDELQPIEQAEIIPPEKVKVTRPDNPIPVPKPIKPKEYDK